MDVPVQFVPALRDLVRTLIRGNYAVLDTDSRIGRLTAHELRVAMMDYQQSIAASGGGTLVEELPDEAFQSPAAEAISIVDQPGQWAVDLDLWTERDRSDLTLSVLVQAEGDQIHVQIDDLHPL